jgi:hypothetical protein
MQINDQVDKQKNESKEVWEFETKKQKEMFVLYIYGWNLSWLLGLHHGQWFECYDFTVIGAGFNMRLSGTIWF